MNERLAEAIADAVNWPGYYRGASFYRLRWDRAADAVEAFLAAQAIEAATAGETAQTGSTVGESAVPQGCAQTPPPSKGPA